MTEIRVSRYDLEPLDRVTVENPFPVSVENNAPPGYKIVTRQVTIPGTVAADALDAGDAMGTPFIIPNVTEFPGQGWEMASAHLLDKSDQAGTVEIVLFSEPIAGTANDAEFAPSDAELNQYVGMVSFATYLNFGANQVSSVQGSGLPSGNTTLTRHLYAQAVVRGTPTVAAGAAPVVTLVFRQIQGSTVGQVP